MNRPTPRSGVIVTGAGSGLGRATALVLAEIGRPIAAWDLDGDAARRTATECHERFGVAATAAAVDVTDRSSLSPPVEQAETSLGSVGAVVAAAGILRYGGVGVQDPTDWDATLATNLSGVLHTIEAALPALRRAKPGSAIVAIASTEAIRGFSGAPAYSAAKHGVIGLVRSAALGLGREGIRANALCPGAMDTPMLAAGLELVGEEMRDALAASIPLGRIADPLEIARVARFLLSDDASYVNGSVVMADGGMTAGMG